MLAIEGVPDRFRMMSISFYADEEEVKRVECPYGGSVPITQYPEIPVKQGFYADWDIKDLSKVLYDEDVTVEYVRYLTTLASEQMRPNNQSVILVDGMFRQEDTLSVIGSASNSVASESGGSKAELSPENPTEHWTIEIPDDGDGAHQIRYQAPEGQTEGVTICVRRDGEWTQADTELMGIYHLFTVEGTEAEIAVCVEEKSITDYLIYIIPAAVVVLIAVILLIRKIVKKRRASRASEIVDKEESEKETEDKEVESDF